MCSGSGQSSTVSCYEDDDFKVTRIVTSRSDQCASMAIDTVSDTPIKNSYSESGQKILKLASQSCSEEAFDEFGFVDFDSEQMDYRKADEMDIDADERSSARSGVILNPEEQ